MKRAITSSILIGFASSDLVSETGVYVRARHRARIGAHAVHELKHGVVARHADVVTHGRGALRHLKRVDRLGRGGEEVPRGGEHVDS
eukprot:4985790-Pyramimonas_sp.AAC.1